MIRIVATVLVLGIATASAAAQTRDVQVTQTISGVDTTAPSVPANVAATPLSIASIQLNWSASTDNVGVAGYRVYRDGVALATTTLTSYLDTGLATSTAYSYYVTAFDAVGNVSASSSVVTASTFAPKLPPGPTGSNLAAGTEIADLRVRSTMTTLEVTFNTDRYVFARTVLTDGSGATRVVLADRLAEQHRIVFDALEPDTQYAVSIEVFIDDRFIIDTQQLQAVTDALPDTTAPANVTELVAVDRGQAVELRWQNPSDLDFDRVRIVRSTRWFPVDLVDGWVIYEGTATSFVDRIGERPVYYTVFSIDATGNRSSGAIAYVAVQDGTTNVSEGLPIPPSFIATTTPADSVVFLEQRGVISTVVPGNPISITTAVPFTLRVSGTGFGPGLRSVVGTLTHPNDGGTFHFLLRRTKATDDYRAVIGALPTRGQYQLTVQWLDFATETTGSLTGTIAVTAMPTPAAKTTVPAWWIFVISLLVVIVLRILWRWRW